MGQDPAIGEVKRLFKQDGHSLGSLHKESGVSIGAMDNWFKGKTRMPQNATLEAAGRALGFKREWVKIK